MGTNWSSPDETRVGAERLQKVVDVLATATDLKGCSKPTHVGAVAHLAVGVGRAVGLPPARIGHLHRAALLHDVGKVMVPDWILLKPGRLDPREWGVMRIHPTEGSRIVNALDMGDEAGSVLHHHERWDGRGYPDGLSSESIPIQSRIIFICDAWCAMREERVYARAKTELEALGELDRGTGTQFDPELVPVLFGVLGFEEAA